MDSEGDRMKVTIKEFDVAMEVKNNGIELEVYSTNGTEHLGDLFVTKSQLIWCKGKTSRKKGVKKSWKEFIEYMETPDE